MGELKQRIKIKIMNTLQSLSKKEYDLLNELLNDYKQDPNCWPALWIASENVSGAVKSAFIKSVVK